MTTTRLLLFTLILGPPLALGAAAILALESSPRVERAAEVTPNSIGRARRLLAAHDPRRRAAGVERTVAVTEEDLDQAANALAHRYGRGGARVALAGGTATLTATARLPDNPVGAFLNVELAATGGEPLPRIERLRLGRLPVPAWLANELLAAAVARLRRNDSYGFAADALRSVAIADGRVAVTYEWPADAVARLRAAVVTPEDRERLRAYHGELVRVAAAGSLADLVGPLFDLARRRGDGGDPVAENRAALLVLALHAVGKTLGALVPEARDWPRPAVRRVTLGGRDDLAKHFAVSAALAANAGGPLADAVGLYKELDDARRGSGFSFVDLAADRAGTRFGEQAAESRASAAALQRRLAGGVKDQDLLPGLGGLPEGLSEAEFQRRFGGVGAPAYRKLAEEIERRLDALPLYR